MSQRPSHPPSQPQRYHQDYIVRIRYVNTLPPPTNPPKLLDIPNNAAALYTSTTFASKLARAEPLNIEVDAELGLPLDLTHTPRVFEGDDTFLRPLDPPPPVAAADRALLRPAAALGKSASRSTNSAAVSFLRRTEYISSEQSRSTFKARAAKSAAAATRRPEEADPVRILEAVLKGFDVANPETAAPGGTLAVGDKAAANAEQNWKTLRHPMKPGIRAVETYPLLPDLMGGSDQGGYTVFKFSSAPTEAEDGGRDERVDTGLVKPVEVDGVHVGMFDFYVPSTPSVASSLKRKLSDLSSPLDPASSEEPPHKFQYVRRYEIKNQMVHESGDGQPEEIAITLSDAGALFYPVSGRLSIRPRRRTKRALGMTGAGIGDQVENDDEGVVPSDALRVSVREMTEAERKSREEVEARWKGVEVSAVAAAAEDEDADAPGEPDD